MMILQAKTYLFAAILVFIAAGKMAGPAMAWEQGKVVDVTISSDLRKVMIQTEGDVGQHSTLVLDKPSRLVVDFPGAGLDLSERTTAEQRAENLQVRTAKTRSGARVVLDFGRGRVPEYKIHRMGNDLVVFLEDWTAPATASDYGRQAENALRAPASPPVIRRQPDAISSEIPGLEVKSAGVVGRLIVLKVVDRENPHKTYRVELGLDLDRLGFSSARIVPPSGQKAAANDLATPEVRVVPRSEAASRAIAENSTYRYAGPAAGGVAGPSALANGLRTGQVPAPGTSVSQDDAMGRGRSLLVPTQSHLPQQQPVTESLRAKLYGATNDPAKEPRGLRSFPDSQESAQNYAAPEQTNSWQQSGPAHVHRMADQLLGYGPK